VTPRLVQLALHRDYHFAFFPDRPTPIWQVSKAALNCPGRERSNTLAIPRAYDKDFVPDRIHPFPISEAALKYIATER